MEFMIWVVKLEDVLSNIFCDIFDRSAFSILVLAAISNLM